MFLCCQQCSETSHHWCRSALFFLSVAIIPLLSPLVVFSHFPHLFPSSFSPSYFFFSINEQTSSSSSSSFHVTALLSDIHQKCLIFLVESFRGAQWTRLSFKPLKSLYCLMKHARVFSSDFNIRRPCWSSSQCCTAALPLLLHRILE